MTSREEIVLALKYFFDVETEASVHEIIGQESDPVDTIAAALDEYRKVDSREGWKRMPYAWAIEHKVGLPTVVFSKPNTNSWAFKDAVIKELYEAPEREGNDDI